MTRELIFFGAAGLVSIGAANFGPEIVETTTDAISGVIGSSAEAEVEYREQSAGEFHVSVGGLGVNQTIEAEPVHADLPVVAIEAW